MATIVAPDERECERCGRRDYWDHDEGTWRIEVVDGQKQAGNPYCIHEWDINGTYNPLPEADR